MRNLSEINLTQTGCAIERPAPSAKVIASFEREFNISFPEDYITLLMYCNGGRPEWDMIDLDGGSPLAGEGISRFCHLDEDRESTEGLWWQTRAWRRVLGEKAIPVAGDGVGNVYYLDFTSSPPKVMFCDHDQNFATFEVAPSFGDFIDSLRYDPDMI